MSEDEKKDFSASIGISEFLPTCEVYTTSFQDILCKHSAIWFWQNGFI
jgi:hypothetical protein